jgi:hypothetical protein
MILYELFTLCSVEEEFQTKIREEKSKNFQVEYEAQVSKKVKRDHVGGDSGLLKILLSLGIRPPLQGDLNIDFFPLIKSCWDSDPNLRPYFHEIPAEIDELGIKIVSKMTGKATIWKTFEQTEISWQEFYSNFSENFLSGPLQNDPILAAGKNSLKYLLVEKRGDKEVVSLDKWCQWCCCFHWGIFSSLESLSFMFELCKKNYFYGFSNKQEIEVDHFFYHKVWSNSTYSDIY